MNPWNLTERQCRVLEVLAEQGCTKLVARALNVSPKTVGTHMDRIMPKMGARNRTQAVVFFDRWARGAST